MDSVTFYGKVQPPFDTLSVGGLPRVDWPATESESAVALFMALDSSYLKVRCEVESYSPSLLGELHKRAIDFAQTLLDLVTFCTGYPYSIRFDAFSGTDGVMLPFRARSLHLGDKCTAFRIDSKSDEDRAALRQVAGLTLTEPALFMALRDLTQSFSSVHYTVLNCARAIDGLCTIMTPIGKRRDQGWPVLQRELNLSEDYIKYITHHSKGPRHGDRSFIPGSVNDEVMTRSWTIMNRFLEYRKRDSKQLPSDQFPML